MKTTVSYERTWHPVFMVDASPDVYDTLNLAEVDNKQLEEYLSLVDEFIVLQNKLEWMFKQMTE